MYAIQGEARRGEARVDTDGLFRFMERGNGMLGACPVQAYVDCVHFSLLFDKIYPIIN
jgi:hypothetical protein